MVTYFPIIVVILALVAAGSIAFIAWQLSSEEFHNSLEVPPSDDPSDTSD